MLCADLYIEAIEKKIPVRTTHRKKQAAIRPVGVNEFVRDSKKPDLLLMNGALESQRAKALFH